MKRPARAPSQLSESLHQRLNAYALAASAAGVGILALVPHAEAKIVYTPTYVVMNSQSLEHWYGYGNGMLTFNFSFYHWRGASSSEVADLRGLQGRFYKIYGKHYESALPPGFLIGPGGAFGPENSYMALVVCATQTRFIGPWANGGKGVKDRYLGLRSETQGQAYYGWARLKVRVSGCSSGKPNVYTVLTGYAYETIPNKPIIAGKTKGPDVITVEPVSLGHLAAGASAIPAWRSGK
jgi:hypothetical protein